VLDVCLIACCAGCLDVCCDGCLQVCCVGWLFFSSSVFAALLAWLFVVLADCLFYFVSLVGARGLQQFSSLR
jgi:hypothetical protein